MGNINLLAAFDNCEQSSVGGTLTGHKRPRPQYLFDPNRIIASLPVLPNMNTTLICVISFICMFCIGSSLAWHLRSAWLAGPQGGNAWPNIGTKGVASSSYYPGARDAYASAYDPIGKAYYVFGGYGYDSNGNLGTLGDVWRFRLSDLTWTWLSGVTTKEPLSVVGPQFTHGSSYSPGSRVFSCMWFNSASNALFLFGGYGWGDAAHGYLNDVWKFDLATSRWAWWAGPTQPNNPGASTYIGARERMTCWWDQSAQQLWAFGGKGYDLFSSSPGMLNTMWRYNLAAGSWTKLRGTNSFDAPSVRGNSGQFSSSFVPSSRARSAGWFLDSVNDELWLFGGEQSTTSGDALLNDIWKFQTTSETWAWIGGSTGALNVRGVFDGALAFPGSRMASTAGTDTANSSLLLFGGYGYGESSTGGQLNDLWSYNYNTNVWTFLAGSKSFNVLGKFGAVRNASASLHPGGRLNSNGAYDSSLRQLLVFGGWGGSSSGLGYLGDLWILKFFLNCSTYTKSRVGVACNRHDDGPQRSFTVTASALTSPQTTGSYCSNITLPAAQISSCGSTTCLRSGACPAGALASLWDTTSELCLTNGETCGANLTCTSTGRCATVNGAGCGANSSCASGICNFVSRTCCATTCRFDQGCDAAGCTKQPGGKSCSTGSDCASGSCGMNGLCCSSACPSDYYCNSQGSCLATSGKVCNSTFTCVNSTCSSTGYCCESCPAGRGCDSRATCLLLNGQRCSSQFDCLSGICTPSGFCCASNCSAGYSCAANGICAVSNGGSCTNSTQCTSGNCAAERCCPLSCTSGCDPQGRCQQALGTLCDEGADCLSGHCSASGHCCSTNCTLPCYTCSSGTCEPLPDGPSPLCPQVNCNDKVAGWSLIGATCVAFSEFIPGRCQNGQCNTSLMRCLNESSVTFDFRPACRSSSCLGECPLLADASQYSLSRTVCNISGEPCEVFGSCRADGECAMPPPQEPPLPLEPPKAAPASLLSPSLPPMLAPYGMSQGPTPTIQPIAPPKVSNVDANANNAPNAQGGAASDTNSNSSLSSTMMGVIGGVGAILGILLVLGAVLAFVLVRRRRRQQRLAASDSDESVELSDDLKRAFNIQPSELITREKLGEGSYGIVFRGEYRGRVVAIKKLPLQTFSEAIGEFFREAMLNMSIQRHPNVIQVFGMCQEPMNLCIVMEYVDGGSLYGLLRKKSKKKKTRHDGDGEGDENVDSTPSFLLFAPGELKKLALGIASGMASLASQRIIHRDLAARNVLITKDLTPKIADFGLARYVGDDREGKTKSTVGPIRHMAPESIREQKYSEFSDVWAYGCVLLEIWTRRPPFSDISNLMDIAIRVRDGNEHPEIPQDAPEWMQSLMMACWAADPQSRPTFSQIVASLEDIEVDV